MTSRLASGGLMPAVACLLLASASMDARAQAWVPEPEMGVLSLDYQTLNVDWHLFSQDVTAFGGEGTRADLGGITSHVGAFKLDYGIVRNLALNGRVAYVQAMYDGSFPESPEIDNGDYHGSFQDAAFGLRYMLPWKGFAITPAVGYSFPTHDYEHHGHAAVGGGKSAFSAGINIGRSLYPSVPNVWFHAAYQHDFVEDIEEWGLDVDQFSISGGWFITPHLSLAGVFSYLETEDGIDWYWADFTVPSVEHNHDRAAQALARRIGGTIGYQATSTVGFYLNVDEVLSGANTHDFTSFTFGTSWVFMSPFSRQAE